MWIAVAVLFVASSPTMAQVEYKLTAPDGSYDDGFGGSVGVSGDVAVVGASRDDDNGSESGSAYVYRWSGLEWVEEQKLIAYDGTLNDGFGVSVGVSGDVVVVGAYGDDANDPYSGSAYVFRWSGTEWVEEQKLTASDGTSSDQFGTSVAVSGDIAVIGSRYDGYGSAYVFRWNGMEWVEEQKLTASDGADGDVFGISVAISGDAAIVGANGDENNSSGSAYVFRWDGSEWVEEQKLVPSDGAAYDLFGNSVGLQDDVAVIGAYGDDDNGYFSGSAYVFRWDGSEWVEEQKLTASDGAAGDEFGAAVAVADGEIVAGARRDGDSGTNSGSAYAYSWNGSEWVEEQKLTASDGASHDFFGHSVSLAGGVTVLGAFQDDDNGSDSGSAYVVDLDAVSPIAVARGTLGRTLTVEGVVTRAAGDFTYLQDDTGALSVRQTSGPYAEDVAAGVIAAGTRVRIRAVTSELRHQVHINEGDLASYQVMGAEAVPEAQPVTLQELVTNGEAHEAELVEVAGLATDSIGAFLPSTSYAVTDDTGAGALWVPSAADTEVDGTTIPAGSFTFRGVVGQFSVDDPDEGYRLVGIAGDDVTPDPGSLCPLEWSATVAAESGGTVSTLMLGQGDAATDAIDPDCGEEELPPAPPGFETRLLLPGGMTGSYTDFRSTLDDDADWTISISGDSAVYPVLLTWDPTALPAGGAFLLRDASTGGDAVSVNMRTATSFEVTDPAVDRLEVLRAHSLALDVPVHEGWNLLSVPVAADEMTPGALFPSAVSSFFAFDTVYVAVDSLQNGRGYWARFADASSHTVAGDVVEPQDVAVDEGWNIVGFYETPAFASDVVSEPEGLMASSFFEYEGGYVVAEELVPGRAYWVKSAAGGMLYAGTPGGGATRSKGEAAELVVADASGRSSALYLVPGLEPGSDEAGAYVLPPVPPADAFDARFIGTDSSADGRYGVGLEEGAWTLALSGATYPVTLSLDGLPEGHLHVSDAEESGDLDAVLENDGVVSIEAPIDIIAVRHAGSVASEEGASPGAFSLAPVYPNPAASAVRVSYVIPVAAQVRVSVYDVLGREVAVLTHGEVAAGQHEATLRADRLASGVYVVRMQAEGANVTFVQNRRITVVR